MRTAIARITTVPPAGWLTPRFGERVGWLAGAHVAAKRYLVATESDYTDTLSPTSIRSLRAQGGAGVDPAILGTRGGPTRCGCAATTTRRRSPERRAASIDEVLEVAARVVRQRSVLSGVPKAHSVRNGLDEILAGLVEGDPVPAERELAARFGVARDTIRQALHELLLAGPIQRRGRGTVMAKPKLVQPLSLRSYTEGADRMGRKPGRTLVTWNDVDATADIAGGWISRGDGHASRTRAARRQPTDRPGKHLPARHRFSDLTETFDPTTSLHAAIRRTGWSSVPPTSESRRHCPHRARPRCWNDDGDADAAPAPAINRSARPAGGDR